MRIFIIALLMGTCFGINAQNVQELRYFIDSDPGFGNEEVVLLSPPAENGTYSVLVNISPTISPGFHRLYFRTKDENNNYSHTLRTTIEVTVEQELPEAVMLEYFFDTDLGVGANSSIELNPISPDSTWTINIPVAEIIDGVPLRVRVRDNSPISDTESGLNWSHTINIPFEYCIAQDEITSYELLPLCNTLTAELIGDDEESSISYLWDVNNDGIYSTDQGDLMSNGEGFNFDFANIPPDVLSYRIESQDCPDFTIIEEVPVEYTDLNLEISGDGTLTVGEEGASYQWYTCVNGAEFESIPGATSQSYTPESEGSYAVEVTVGDCTDFSECINTTSIETLDLQSLRVYPNPANEYLKLELDHFNGERIQFELRNSIGQLIYEETIKSQLTTVSLDFPGGLYFVILQTENKQYAHELIIQD